MISVKEYFEKYLGYKMQVLSNNDLSARNFYFETFRNLDDKLLIFHAEHENNPGALGELGERSLFFKKDVDAAVDYLDKCNS